MGIWDFRFGSGWVGEVGIVDVDWGLGLMEIDEIDEIDGD